MIEMAAGPEPDLKGAGSFRPGQPGRRWLGSGAEAIDASTRWPLYLLSASEPFLMLIVINSEPHAWTPVTATLQILSVIQALACVLLLRAGLARYLGDGGTPRVLLVVASVLALAGVVIAAVADAGGEVLGPLGGVALIFCAALTGAVTPLLSAWWLFPWVALQAIGAGLLESAFGEPGHLYEAVNFFFIVGSTAVTYRFSVWMLGLAWEMNWTKEVQAQLAVAEERLRVARDLHDVLGRNLALIAVNSQLAAELVRRGQDGALERMLDVHRTAQDSMRDVREVVAGSRTVDLASELAGARSVLRSAGIQTRVIGDGTILPPDAQAAFGWVIREATTNIIRHSDPTAVRIDLEVGPGTAPAAGGRVAMLRIENDGAPPASDPNHGGTGLSGLRERLTAIGGELVAAPGPGGSFLVSARVPVEAES